MKYFDKINRKLKGEMSASEAAEFDQELQENEELAKAYELQQMEEDLLSLAVEEDLLAEIKAIRNEQSASSTKETKVVQMRSWRRVLSIAAGLAFLLAAYFMWNNGGEDPSYMAIAQEGYRTNPPNLSGTKAVGDDPQAFETNKQLLLSSSQQDLGAAITFFETEKADSPEAAYYLGHGYGRRGDYEKSLLNFDYFLEQAGKDDRLRPAAEYYKALTLLALGESNEVKTWIQGKKGEHPFQKPFEVLLKKIERN